MAQYNLLGLLLPLTISLKLMLRKLYSSELSLSWTDPLPQEEQRKWTVALQAIMSMSPVTFPRSVRPKGASLPWVVAFWDGSLEAYGTTVYVRWESQEGVEVRLLTAKARVAPLKGSTVTRMELQGLVMCLRTLRTVVEAVPFAVERLTVLGDSICAIMAAKKEGTGE